MTSLAQQLKQLALPGANVEAELKKRQSLLFDSQKAATLDRDTLYGLGLNGFEALCSIDPTLLDDFVTLFNEGAKSWERSVLTKKDEQALDKLIKNFLSRGTPYFLSRSLQKCLEWLIYRFRIHDFNAEDILATFLPYHETKLYSRILQLLDASLLNKRWRWIGTIQKPVHLPTRSMVTEQCLKDSSFLAAICDNVLATIRAHRGPGVLIDASLAVNLYSVYTLEVIFNIEDRKNEFLAQIMPYIVKGIESAILDFRACTYMIICGIAANMELKQEIIFSLIELMSNNYDKRLQFEYLATVLALCQLQRNVKGLPKSCVQIFCDTPNALEILKKFDDTHDIHALITTLIKQLISQICNEESTIGVEDTETLQDLLMTILRSFCFPVNSQKFVIRTFMNAFRDGNDASKMQLIKPIQLVEKKYPQTFDDTIKCLKRGKTGHAEYLDDLLKMSLRSLEEGASPDITFSPFALELAHASPDLRLSAISNMAEMIRDHPQAVSSDSTRNAIKSRLCVDDSSEVLLAALDFVKNHPMSFFYDTGEASDVLIGLILNKRSECNWAKVWQTALELLLSDHFLSTNVVVFHKIALIACDVLLCATSTKSTQRSVTRSPFVQKISWLLSLAKENSTESIISNMVRNLTKNPDLIQHLRNASGKISEALQKRNDYYGFSLRIPFHYLVNYAALKIALDENSPNVFQSASAIFQEVITDFKILLSASSGENDKQSPMDRTSVDAGNFGSSLRSLADIFYGAINKSDCLYWKIDVLSCMLFDCMNFAKHSEKCDHKNEKILHWDSLSGQDSSVQSMHRIVRYSLFDFLIEVLPIAPADISKSLKEMLRNFFVCFFRTPEDAICYLMQFCSPDMCDSMRLSVPVQALSLATALLKQNGVNFSKLLAGNCILIPSLVTATLSNVAAIRKVSLRCLIVIEQSKQKSLFMDLVKELVDNKDILIADRSSLHNVLSSFFSVKGVHKARSAQGRSRRQILDSLFSQHIFSPNAPIAIRATLLHALEMVNSKSLCCSLAPALNESLDSLIQESDDSPNESSECHYQALFISAALSRINGEFLAESKIKSSFYKALKCDAKISLEINADTSPQFMCLGLINKDFFAAIDDKTQKELLKTLLCIPLTNKDALELVGKVFKSIRLSSDLVVDEFKEFFLASEKNSSSPAKKRKYDKDPGTMLNWIQKIILLLELLQQKKKITNQQALLPPLFRLLEMTLETPHSQHAESSEYMKQLVLTMLLKLLEKLKQSSKDGQKVGELISNLCKVEVIVHSVRSSENTQTQHHALLLLSEIATLFPEKVLHNVMAIFTFMGSHLLRQDDPYSYQIINTTMRTVIPALMKADFGRTTKDKDLTVLDIIHAFVDALPHMPSHRRIITLRELLHTLDGTKHLWVLLLVLVNMYVRKPVAEEVQSVLNLEHSNVESDGTTSALIPFQEILNVCGEVCDAHPFEIQLRNLLECLKYLLSLPFGENEKHPVAGRRQKSSTDIIKVNTLSVTQLRRFFVAVLAVFSHVIERNRENLLHNLQKMVKSSSSDSSEMIILLQGFYENLFTLVNKANTANSTKQSGKFFKVLLTRTSGVISEVNLVLPFKVILQIIDSLLGSEWFFIRQKSLELLAERLSSSTTLLGEEISAVSDVSARLAQMALTTIQEHQTPNKNKDQMTLIYNLLLTLKIAVRKCGKSSPGGFVKALEAMCDILASPSMESISVQVLSAVFLCLAEMCSCLKAYCIPYLNRFIPVVLQTTCEYRTLENESLLFSCVTVIHRLLENLPGFTGSHLEKVIEKTTMLMLLEKYKAPILNQAESDTICGRIGQRLKAIISIIASKIPSRTLISSISNCQVQDAARKASLTKSLCILFLKHVECLDKDAVMQCSTVLFPLLYEFLDFRRKRSRHLRISEITEVEDFSTEITAAAMLKLPEKSFRIYLFELYDWASTDDHQQNRLIAYYKVELKLSNKMKGLFSLFAGGIVEGVASVLQKNSSENEVYLESESQELLRLMCDCLSSTLFYDTSGILTKDKFELILQPLVDHIEILASSVDNDSAASLLIEHVIPCLAQLAASVPDGSCRKLLNYQICMKSRSSSSKVRLYSLKSMEAVAEKLREEYTALLPESIPFLSELMEDDVEAVEEECHRVVKKLENILGEPLQEYFSA